MMSESILDSEHEAELTRLSERFDFSVDAVRSMFAAIERGDGRMAQFAHPEFGGHGQWMASGMLMVGDMFNDSLKERVLKLCTELAQMRARRPAQDFGGGTAGQWWPAEFGRPGSAGGQNAIRYAYFAPARRLVLDRDGAIEIYDTGDHAISGVAQQQSNAATVAFTSQHGLVDITKLRRL